MNKIVLRWLAGVSFLLVIVVVGLGAWTRLSDAGLGCPDWPGCYGFVTLPSTEQEVQQAEIRYPDAPYEADKAFWEVVHRYFAAGIGLLIAMLFLASLRSGDRGLMRLTAFTLAAVGAQGFLGYLTVDLKLWPPVVVSHLLGGLLIASMLWLIVLRLFLPRPVLPPALWRKWRPWLVLGLTVVAVQITLGGWVSSNYAALACPDVPKCQGQWLPPTDFAQGFSLMHPPGPSYLHGRLNTQARTAIHLTHRFGALVALLVVGALGIALIRTGIVRTGALLLALLGLQIGLGLANVLTFLSLPVAVAHNLGAGALLLCMLLLLVRKSAD